jgi:hypothetical protein
MRRAKVITDCVADNYSHRNERIIEFVFPDGSDGLIKFIANDNGENIVQIYNCDKNIIIHEENYENKGRN